jgi:hypothetical protein
MKQLIPANEDEQRPSWVLLRDLTKDRRETGNATLKFFQVRGELIL